MQISAAGNNSYFQTNTYVNTVENKGSENYNSIKNSETSAIIEPEASKMEDTTATDSKIKKVDTHLSQILLSAWFQKKLEEAKINFQQEQGEITGVERNNLQKNIAQNDVVKKEMFGTNTKVVDLVQFLENAEAFMANKATPSKSVNIKA